MRFFKKIIACFLILFFHLSLFSQQQSIPLNHSFFIEKERQLCMMDENEVSTGFKPIKIFFENTANEPKKIETERLFKRKLKRESLFIVTDSASAFKLTIDPIFHFEIGRDQKDILQEKLYQNTRGLLIRGDIGKNFSFESSFYENQSTLPSYLDSFCNTFDVVPGQGRWKNFKLNGYDYAMAMGHISYSPNRFFNFQLGHGKHFIGEGYRSLLLSDNAFNYPFLRISTRFKKIQYTNQYCVLMNLTDGGVATPPYTERLFQKKAAQFQFLEWHAHKRLWLSFFQGMIWQASDKENKQHLTFQYFNPILYSQLISYSFNGKNNIVAGMSTKIKCSKTIFLYSQLMIDDIAKKGISSSLSNKVGFQLGIKLFDLFKIKNLYVQMEYNQVRPYAYSSNSVSQNYSHYNQSITHPLGANFKELIVSGRYRIHDFFTEYKINYTFVGKDSVGKYYGNSIFLSDQSAYYGSQSTINKQNQGIASTILYSDFKLGYVINPITNMNIVIGVVLRREIVALNEINMNYLYIGFRTSILNRYYDF